MKFGRTETKDAVSSETSHGVSNSVADFWDNEVGKILDFFD